MFIYILSVLTILVHYPQVYNSGFLRIDYYESLSYPILCFIMSHYHPTGPSFLFIILNYNLSSYIFGFMAKNVTIRIGLKKIKGSCNGSIIFSTMGKDFKKIGVEILVSFYYNHPFAINIFYTIYQGIVMGLYEFWDYNKHFSFSAKITDDMKECLETSNSTLNEIESYLNSVSNTQGDICLVTDNNNAAVLTPIYRKKTPYGLVSSFVTDYFENMKFVEAGYYPAFQCAKNHIYPNETLFLIVDQTKVVTFFYAIYSKLKDGIVYNVEYELEFSIAKFENYNNLVNIPLESKKLFLHMYLIGIISCPDGTRRTVHMSTSRHIYYITQPVFINISSSLEQKQYISHSLGNIC